VQESVLVVKVRRGWGVVFLFRLRCLSLLLLAAILIVVLALWIPLTAVFLSERLAIDRIGGLNICLETAWFPTYVNIHRSVMPRKAFLYLRSLPFACSTCFTVSA
jgi:hypothetical protein